MANNDQLPDNGEMSGECPKPSFTGSSTKDARILSDEENAKLEKDKNLVSDFKQSKLEAEAERNWDIFYKRNTTKFFKDRHWTTREFGELVNTNENEEGRQLVVFEVGCGVGNFMFPLLDDDTSLYFYACDFSKRAVQFVKEDARFDPDRCTAFHSDITQDRLTNHIPAATVDVATMIFVLSAIHPDKMAATLQNIFQVLRPGGCLLIRDYGLYDHAMLRFAPGHKLDDNFYVRQDGTRAFYFSLEILEKLMSEAGFQVGTNEYIQRQTVNKKEGLSVPRIFVQGKFVKPNVTKPFCDLCTNDSSICNDVGKCFDSDIHDCKGSTECDNISHNLNNSHSVVKSCDTNIEDSSTVGTSSDGDIRDTSVAESCGTNIQDSNHGNTVDECFDSKLNISSDQTVQTVKSTSYTEDIT